MACKYNDKLFTHLHKSPFFCIVHSLTAGCESYGSCEVSWGALGRNSSSRYHLKRQMRNIAIPDSRLCGRPVGIANCLRIPSSRIPETINQTKLLSFLRLEHAHWMLANVTFDQSPIHQYFWALAAMTINFKQRLKGKI